MAGTWLSENKIIPGAYINFLTNEPLSITVGDRGIVVLLQELSVGSKGELYTITALDNNLPKGATDDDKKLINEALKGAKTVLLYNLGPSDHQAQDITDALAKLKTVNFNVLAYPYDGVGYATNKEAIVTWIKAMRDEEGVKIQGVLANSTSDNEAIINVVQGIELSNGSKLKAEEVTAYVAGITAGANVNKSNTGNKYVGAVDVNPRMTKTEMEEAIKAGKFIFKVDSMQNVTCVYDINSLTSVTKEKGSQFKKNRVIRTIDGINNDVTTIFESNVVGKEDNNANGRSILRAMLIEYFNELQRLNAIQNFTAEDVIVEQGKDKDSVLVTCNIQTVDSIEKIYITVNLS